MGVKRLTEKAFLAQVIALARLCRWKVYHTHDSRHSQAGFPDLVLLKGPRLIFAELKVGRNRATPEQVEWMEALLPVPGVEVFLWLPNDWDQIKQVLGFEEASHA